MSNRLRPRALRCSVTAEPPWRALMIACVMIGSAVTAGRAQDQPAAPPEPEQKSLVVGTRHVPPFAIKGDDGRWSGVTIDLWRKIAEAHQLSYEFREMELDEMLNNLSDGSIDAAAAALTVTGERAQRMDFTHPYYTTGLGIAVKPKSGSRWLSVLRRLFSGEFLGVVGALALVLLGAGALLWLAERKRNRAQFGGGMVKGLGNAFWWSAVTMTTVGYGDKAPVTFFGRLVALVWMFAAIIIISAFTAAIASALTVGSLETGIRGPQDLRDALAGAVRDSTGEEYMLDNFLMFDSFDTPDEGLAAVVRGDIDAMVHDAPLLQYVVNREYRGELAVLPQTFERQDYAIALPNNSPLRKAVNQTVVETIRTPGWREILYRYLGQTEGL